MGSIGVFVEVTIIFSLVCAASLICHMQAYSLRSTYYVYVFDVSQTLTSRLKTFSNLARAGGGNSYVLEPEFEDSDWDLDMVYDNQLLSFEAEESWEGNLSIICWFGLETYQARESTQGMLIWRAPCYQDLEMQQQSDTSLSTECQFWVSREGEMKISFADGEVVYRSNSTISGAERMVLSKENDILLLNEDRQPLWSSRGNKVFHCIE